MSQNVGVTFDQVKDLLGLFSKSFDKFNDSNSRIDVISQESYRSFSAPTVVAGRNEPTPDRTPFAAYSDVLGANLGGPAATEASSGVGFPSQMLLGEFLARIRLCKFGYLPDNYFGSLHGKVIHSPDYSLYLSGDAIFDSVRSFRSRLLDPVSPLPGSSRDSDSVIPFLCSLLGVTNPYLLCRLAISARALLGVLGCWCRLGLVVWFAILGSCIFCRSFGSCIFCRSFVR